jgi:hypothetical protein
MRAELAGALRRASVGKICRTPADHTADCADAGRNKTAVGQLADPDGEIDIVFPQVDDAVGERDRMSMSG